jgi:hypothetical protein
VSLSKKLEERRSYRVRTSAIQNSSSTKSGMILGAAGRGGGSEGDVAAALGVPPLDGLGGACHEHILWLASDGPIAPTASLLEGLVQRSVCAAEHWISPRENRIATISTNTTYYFFLHRRRDADPGASSALDFRWLFLPGVRREELAQDVSIRGRRRRDAPGSASRHAARCARPCFLPEPAGGPDKPSQAKPPPGEGKEKTRVIIAG